MRLTFLALFLCTCLSAMCQPMAPVPKTSERAGQNPQGSQPWTECNSSMPDLSISNLTPRTQEHRFSAPTTWLWNDAQMDSNNLFQSPNSNSEARIGSKNAFPFCFCKSPEQSCSLVAQNGEPNPYQMLFRQWPNAKVEPIPTQWPNAKFERIPTEWPDFKMMPIQSR